MVQASENQGSDSKDQQHPQWSSDRQIVDRLLREDLNDYNLAELARLRIRYSGFPGARDIQADIEKVLQQWNLTEDALYTRTRQIHAVNQVYRSRSGKQDDWT
jgi:hypothetical protein